MGVVLRAHPVRGESRIQRSATGEVATIAKQTYTDWIVEKKEHAR